jgi:hypothetical protein
VKKEEKKYHKSSIRYITRDRIDGDNIVCLWIKKPTRSRKDEVKGIYRVWSDFDTVVLDMHSEEYFRLNLPELRLGERKKIRITVREVE